MIHTHHLLSLALIALATQLHAGNFTVETSRSELAADVSASPPHTFSYTATEFFVDIQINPQTLELQKATCAFKFDSLDSKKPKRDKKMRGWIDTTHYPVAKFELTEVRPGKTKGAQIGVGQFTMHGVSREIKIPFTVRREGATVILDGQAELDTTNWNLEIVRMFFFSVKPVVKPHFHLEGTLANDA